jgi:hypothetical protein
MDYLGKGEMLTNRDINKIVHNIFGKLAFYDYGTFLGYFTSAHETLDKHFASTLSFVQYICEILHFKSADFLFFKDL